MYKYKAIKVNGEKRDQHRVIIENNLGRKLLYNEVVHHGDENKLNNSDDNLKIMSRSEHSRLHNPAGRKLPASTVEKVKKYMQENRTNAKLSIEQVKAVKQMLNEGKKQADIATLFCVSKFVISRIARQECSSFI